MIFRPEMAAKVLAGEKTQTRRRGLTTKYRELGDYAIQPGRGKTAVGRLSVLEVRQQRLFDMTNAEAIAEGFHDVYGFQRYWQELHDEIDLDELVWVITFVVIQINRCGRCLGAAHGPEACPPPSSSTRRFGSRTPR